VTVPTELLVTMVASTLSLAGVVLTGYFSLLSSRQAKAANATAREAVTHARDVSESINNRPTSLSDRLDVGFGAMGGSLYQVDDRLTVLETTTRNIQTDIRELRKDLGRTTELALHQ